MEDALCCFDTFKDGVLLGPTVKKAKVKADALRTELMKKQ